MTEPPPAPYRALDAAHLAASPLLESVNWLLDAMHQQRSAFIKVAEELQHLQAFKDSTEETMKAVKEEMAGLASSQQAAPAADVAGEIAAVYTKDVVERARQASKGSMPVGGAEVQLEESSVTQEIPKVIQEELRRLETDLKTHLRELEENWRNQSFPAEGKTTEAVPQADSESRISSLELQVAELKEKLDAGSQTATSVAPPSAVPSVATGEAAAVGEATAAAAATAATDPVDAGEEDTSEANPPALVVSPPAVVVNPPAVVVNPAVVNPPAVTQPAPAGAEVTGRVQILERQVQTLTEALEVLRESLDFPDDLGPGPAMSAEADAQPGEEVTPVQQEQVAVQTSAPGSKEVPSSGRGSRPGSREGWKTLASSLESLDLRVTALEQWRATTEPPTAPPEPQAPPLEVEAVQPDGPTAEGPGQSGTPGYSTEPMQPLEPSQPPKVPPLRLPKVDQQPAAAVRACMEGGEELEDKLSMLEEMHPLPPEQSNMLNSIVQDVRLCLKRCELILQLPEIKAFIRKFQSSLQVNAVLHDRWLGPKREDDPETAPKIEQCKSMGDLTSVAADPCHVKPKRGEVHKRPFRTVGDWARPHTPLTLDPRQKVGSQAQNGTSLPEI